jgi:cytochrome c556
VKLRQSAYTVLGAQMGIMAGMVQGRAPYDAKAFQVAAERAAFMATVVPDVFPAGSLNASSKAKAELWNNAAEFQKLMKDMQTRTTALVTAAKSGNLETIKPAFGATGASCKACHDKYKAD